MRSKRLRYTIVAGAVLIIASVAALIGWDARADRDPRRVYSRYSPELTVYAERWRAGQVARDVNGEYAMPKFLIERGATHARREGDCLVITFGFMPSDAVPELWFSPTGFGQMPPGIEERRGRAFFRFVQLAPNWAECDWDT